MQGATLDRRAECCASGVLDACGDCDGPAKTVDVQGACCSSKTLDAGGFCCLRCALRIYAAVPHQADLGLKSCVLTLTVSPMLWHSCALWRVAFLLHAEGYCVT